MSGPPDDPPSSTGPPDRQTLRLLERRLADDSLVSKTTFEPDSDEPRELRAHIDTERFPPSIEGARLDCRWFTTGDVSIHYIETTTGGAHWECRWDRHPNAHNSRLHFHHPPDGTDVVDIELPSTHPIDVVSTVIAAVEDRIERLWDEVET